MGRIFEVPWGGVREVAEELLRAAAPICAEQGRRIDVLVPRAGMLPLQHPALREVVLPRFGGSRLLWDHVTVRGHANAQRNAVVYNPKLVLPLGLRTPGFTSIHDLMYFPQPSRYDWREYLLGDTIYMRLLVTSTVRRAPFTHVDSHNTRRDALDLFPEVPPERFVTIHLGVTAERWAPRPTTPEDEREWDALRARGLREPYVLYSGGFSKRKNVKVLARAFARFAHKHPEFTLVMTGGAKPTIGDPELASALEALPKGQVSRLGVVSSRALALLYQRAFCFAFPSLYEGFGLPPLEAQAAGCPVVCSNASSLPEVVGEAALLFDPRSDEELEARLESLMDPILRDRVREAGLRNAATFTWQRTAQEWLALADRVAAAAGN